MHNTPEGTEFFEITYEKTHQIWEKIKNFDRLFDDSERWDEIAFFEKMYSYHSYALETTNGIMIIDIVRRNHLGRCHVIFWDKKLLPKVDLLRECLIWCFLEFNLYVIEAYIPDYARALRRFIEKMMGFSYEGRLRNRIWYKGQLCDMIMFSILREEVLTDGS